MTGSPAEIVVVSPEMTAVFGASAPDDAPRPADCVCWTVDVESATPALRLGRGEPTAIAFLIAREALLRLGGARLLEADGGAFHLPAELRAIALSLREPPCGPETRDTYRLAKSIEFVCEAIRLARAEALAPIAGAGGWSADDTRRMMAARRIIEERSHEKLTLHAIARACGVNRAKLTRGFREMFDCTVAEALASRRLSEAERLLLTTDLPVSSVGYRAGYLNNASFARAFGRRFGRTPSSHRAQALAA